MRIRIKIELHFIRHQTFQLKLSIQSTTSINAILMLKRITFTCHICFHINKDFCTPIGDEGGSGGKWIFCLFVFLQKMLLTVILR